MADGYRSRVRLSLTQREAQALQVMMSEALAGDIDELFAHDGRMIRAAEAAQRKVRQARYAAVDRDTAKGRPPRTNYWRETG